jgi:hypothetical protein
MTPYILNILAKQNLTPCTHCNLKGCILCNNKGVTFIGPQEGPDSLEVYVVFGHTNLTDGRDGHEFPRAGFTSLDRAKEFGKGNYIMGSNSPIRKETVTRTKDGWMLKRPYPTGTIPVHLEDA